MTNKGRRYTADDGKFIVRKSDDFVMGPGVFLGKNDSIENYYERDYDDEEYYVFCVKNKLPIPEKYKKLFT